MFSPGFGVGASLSFVSGIVSTALCLSVAAVKADPIALLLCAGQIWSGHDLRHAALSSCELINQLAGYVRVHNHDISFHASLDNQQRYGDATIIRLLAVPPPSPPFHHHHHQRLGMVEAKESLSRPPSHCWASCSPAIKHFYRSN